MNKFRFLLWFTSFRSTVHSAWSAIATPSLLVVLGAVSFAGCGSGISDRDLALLDEAVAESPRADSLRTLFYDTPRSQRKGMAYLLTFMPRGDRDTMHLDLLRENVEYAYRARDEFSWTKQLPDSVFLNEVLPYAAVDEVRDAWRADFYRRFAPMVASCCDLRAAIDTVNRRLRDEVAVDYNTAREKTNQSPSESMRQHMASCTGLSILLVDALRSVGIPARFAGTPAWHDDRGNHSWVEVWVDGGWHFTEYYPAGLDRSWFLPDAGQANSKDRTHGIYAASFRSTGNWFPMVWNESSHEVHGVDVTDRYRAVYAASTNTKLATDSHTVVTFKIFRNELHAVASADRVAVNVDVFCDGEQMGGGRTAGPAQDMNDALEFLLEKHHTYVFRYENGRGETTEVKAVVEESPTTITCYME